jgi:RHS repeat-associated protein
MYFPVTDVIGKPVLMLSPFGNIAGTGEYDLFGHLNRVFIDAETSHPYGTTNGVFATFAQATPPGFSTDFRVLVDVLDLNWQDANPAVCANWARLRAWDWLDIRDGSGRTYESRAGSTGLFATFWATPPGSAFQLAMRNVGTCTFTPDATGNCTTSCDGVVQPRSKSGVVAASYEYRRYQTAPFWTPLRFPGQYYDDESDLIENWNRYYDPATGRYLQLEPYLETPTNVTMAAKSAQALPSYAYALNDPLNKADPDGLRFRWFPWWPRRGPGDGNGGANSTDGAGSSSSGIPRIPWKGPDPDPDKERCYYPPASVCVTWNIDEGKPFMGECWYVCRGGYIVNVPVNRPDGRCKSIIPDPR